MRRRQWDTTLYELAENQSGYFTAAQARAAGLHQVRLVQLHHSGDIERVTRGVYRLTRYPISPLGEYMEAALWPQVRRPDAHGVISHESALAIYGLSNASPAKIHVTLPTEFRIRRAVPKHLALHYADLTSKDVQRVEGDQSRRLHAPSGMRTPVILDPLSFARRLTTGAEQASCQSMRPRGSSKSCLGRSRAARVGVSSHFAVTLHDIDAKAADRAPAIRRCSCQVRSGVCARGWRQRRTCPSLAFVT